MNGWMVGGCIQYLTKIKQEVFIFFTTYYLFHNVHIEMQTLEFKNTFQTNQSASFSECPFFVLKFISYCERYKRNIK